MGSTPRASFLARLATGPLLLDGACGTQLMKQGLPTGEMPERWVLDRPAAIRELAASYAKAGSAAVYTCTFGANRVRLERAAMAGATRDVAERAAKLAREGAAAAGSSVLVFGDIGPTGEWLEPVGDLTEAAAREAFGELARALVDAGVDALVLETFTDPREAAIAAGAARAAAPGLPVLASMTFEKGAQGLRTATGATPEAVAAILLEAGADVIGVNCGTGPVEAAEVAARMHAAAPAAPLLVKPNAGLPRMDGGRAVYAVGPEAFAASMAGLVRSGVRVVGGCCGTTPDHLRALAERLAHAG
jgi:5-methyltetrahydrofolate--homocysteine methyltransferase